MLESFTLALGVKGSRKANEESDSQSLWGQVGKGRGNFRKEERSNNCLPVSVCFSESPHKSKHGCPSVCLMRNNYSENTQEDRVTGSGAMSVTRDGPRYTVRNRPWWWLCQVDITPWHGLRGTLSPQQQRTSLPGGRGRKGPLEFSHLEKGAGSEMFCSLRFAG